MIIINNDINNSINNIILESQLCMKFHDQLHEDYTGGKKQETENRIIETAHPQMILQMKVTTKLMGIKKDRNVRTTSLVEDLDVETSGWKGVPLFDSHLTGKERRDGEGGRREERGNLMRIRRKRKI